MVLSGDVFLYRDLQFAQEVADAVVCDVAHCARAPHGAFSAPIKTGREQVQQRLPGTHLYSTTSSALACSVSGTVRPSVSAVLRLITSLNFVGT